MPSFAFRPPTPPPRPALTDSIVVPKPVPDYNNYDPAAEQQDRETQRDMPWQMPPDNG